MKKTGLYFKSFFVIFVLLLMNSCYDYIITTKVNADGSIDRIIKVKVLKSDSGSFDEGSIIVPSDSSWEITRDWEYTESEEGDSVKKYVLTARKHFESFEDLNKELNQDTSDFSHVKNKVNLEKRFRWFFTYFKFSETFHRYFPFNYYPAKDFLTENEINFIFNDDEYIYYSKADSIVKKADLDEEVSMTAEDSIRLEEYEEILAEKFFTWQAKNIYEELEIIVNEGLKNEMPDLQETFKTVQDSVYNKILLFPKNLEDIDPVSVVSFYLHIDSATLYNTNAEKFKVFNKKLDNIYEAGSDEYTISIIMPGLVISGNSEIKKGNETIWNIEFDKFFVSDYVMYSESRIVNTWAIVISITVFTLLVVLIMAGLIRDIPK